MTEVSPALIAETQESFKQSFKKNERIKVLNTLLDKEQVTHRHTAQYAEQVGTLLAEAFKEQITPHTLPDGQMHEEIAQEVILPMMQQNHTLIAHYGATVQNVLNRRVGIGIQGIKPELNEDRIKGIIDKLTEAEDFEKAAWLLDEPVVNFSRAVADDVVRVNAETHHKLGLKPKIIRRTSGSCCAWCDALAGVYAYPEVPKDVYRRHRYCRCTVEYAPDGKKRQNVHTKKWTTNRNTTANLPDISQVESTTALNIIDRLNANDVTYNPVTKLPKPLSTEEIVQRLAGGDETGGSCSSVAFCYIGNKHGLDVLDFRGGKSLDEFSSGRAIEAISKLPNVKGSIIKVRNEVQGTMEVLKSLEFGKEYYLAAGRHAAIVRKAEEGLQYLELQASEEDEEENGWTSFDVRGSVEKTLERRFGCKTPADEKLGIIRKKEVFLIDVDSFKDSPDFETLLGYMNTNVNEQKKGAGGHVR